MSDVADCDSCPQVAVSEPGTDLSVQRQLAESQTHRAAAEEPDGAAHVRQRQRAVITQTRWLLFFFLIPTKIVIKMLFICPIVCVQCLYNTELQIRFTYIIT